MLFLLLVNDKVVEVALGIRETHVEQLGVEHGFRDFLHKLPPQLDERASVHFMLPVHQIRCFVAQTGDLEQLHGQLLVVSILMRQAGLLDGHRHIFVIFKAC